MKRGLAIAVTCWLASGVAHAESRPTIKAPPGWTIDHATSKQLTAHLNALGHFGFPATAKVAVANVDLYAAPKPGVTLTVTLVAGAITDQREAAARAAVDELHEAAQRAAMVGTGIVEQGWRENHDTAAKQVEATLTWRDTKEHTTSQSRLLVVADAKQITALTGECYAADDADAKLVAECTAALATLDPGIDTDKRLALALPPSGTRPTPPEPPVKAGSGVEPARMTDGTRAPLPPMTMPQEQRATDRRPVYVGIGLVIFAGVFWWNRRRRARREDES
jgi:hypothetical protein